MKKLLILAYDFPPFISVGGLRPYSWYKYLKEFGIEPIVVTRQWGNKHGNHLDYIEAGSSDRSIIEKTELGTVIYSPYNPNLANRLNLKYGNTKYRILRKVISGYYEFAQFLYSTGPKIEILNAARDYLKSNKVDAIIATGDPFILFKYASQLSSEFNIPWIADYRDPWSHSYNGYFGKSWRRYFERKTLRSASHITSVSSFLGKKINELYTDIPFSIIANGFDPELIDQTSKLQQSNEDLQIAFVGTIYEWHPLFKFLRDLDSHLEKNPGFRLRLNLYGTNLGQEKIKNIHVQFPNLIPCLNFYQKSPNSEILVEIAKNNVMLLFNDYSYLGTKIFDYLGIRRKIILCYSNDPEANDLKNKFYNIEESDTESKHLQADLIKETHSGIIIKDSEHLKEVLKDLSMEFDKNGYIACNSIGVDNYSRKIQVEKLAGIVKHIAISG